MSFFYICYSFLQLIFVLFSVKERLPFGTDLKLQVLKQDAESGLFIIRMPKILDDLNPDDCIEKSSVVTEKELKIKELEAQIEMLRRAAS